MSDNSRCARKYVHDSKFVDQTQQGTAFLAVDPGLASVETDMTEYCAVTPDRWIRKFRTSERE